MPRPSRSSPEKQALFTSLKDRLGALLLLSGIFLYWTLGWKLGRLGTKTIGLEETALDSASSTWSAADNPKEADKSGKDYPIKNLYYRIPANPYPPRFRNFTRPDSLNKKWQDSYNRGLSRRSSPATVLLNLADSAGWEHLPGIGPVLASRIVKYRDRLGGFHSPEQLREVYGIEDSVIERIIPLVQTGNEQLNKIDINQISLDELRRHPYLKWEFAKAIIRYREAHGKFQNADQLKEIWNLPIEVLEKIRPYLSFSTDSISLEIN